MKTKIQKILLLILMTFFTLISFGVLILLFDKKNEIGDFIAYLIIFTITGFLYYYWKTFDERKAKKLDSIYIKKEKKLNNIYTQNVKKLKDRYNEKEKQLENQLLKKDTDVEPSINLTSHESNNNFYNLKKVLKLWRKKTKF